MRDQSMLMHLSRGGAAALFTVALAGPLGAQSAGLLPSRARDSAATVRVLVMSKGRIDSLNVLMRAFEDTRAGSPLWDSVSKQIEALMPSRIMVRRTMNPSMQPKGWIGIVTDGPQGNEIRPDGLYYTYFAHPTIVTVDGQSPAQQAGILPGDILVAYNGLDVVGRAMNYTQLLVPERKLAVTVRRDGETKEFAVTVAKAPERVYVRRMDFDRALLPELAETGKIRVERARAAAARGVPPGGFGGTQIFATTGAPMAIGDHMFVISPNGVLGASVSTVGPALAKVLKLETGVLVNDVPEESPAWKGGLRAGDVIVNVAGQPVASLNQLREMIFLRAADRSVPLHIIRDKKPQNVNVTW